jgi:hypothetical protein
MGVCKFAEPCVLHGRLAFFHVKFLRIEGFRCLDLGKMQYGIHICSFEDVVVTKGMRDGVHFGRGRRFTVRNGVLQTFDDSIALMC